MLSSVLDRANRFKRQRRGLTLIEGAMALALSAVVMGLVMWAFQSANNGQRIQTAQTQLAQVQQAVRAMYAGQPTYSGLSNSSIVQALPSSMVASTGTNAALSHAFNGPLTVAPVANGSGMSNNAFTITMAGLPNDACIRLSTIDQGRGIINLKVNSTDNTSPPYNPTTAQQACGSNNQSTLVWTVF